MKKRFFYSIVLLVLAGSSLVFSQEPEDDNAPYLSDRDMAALEKRLPGESAAIKAIENAANEIPPETQNPGTLPPKTDTSAGMYYLLIIDRIKSVNSDISGTGTFLYKFKHGTDGYLIALYAASFGEAPVVPKNSKVLVDLKNADKAKIREFIDSARFRKYVTKAEITADLQAALDRAR